MNKIEDTLSGFVRTLNWNGGYDKQHGNRKDDSKSKKRKPDYSKQRQKKREYD